MKIFKRFCWFKCKNDFFENQEIFKKRYYCKNQNLWETAIKAAVEKWKNHPDEKYDRDSWDCVRDTFFQS